MHCIGDKLHLCPHCKIFSFLSAVSSILQEDEEDAAEKINVEDKILQFVTLGRLVLPLQRESN